MRRFLSFITAYLLAATAIAQNIVGTVTDEKGQPLALANIVLLQLQDTTFICGTTTHEDGTSLYDSDERRTNWNGNAYYVRKIGNVSHL